MAARRRCWSLELVRVQMGVTGEADARIRRVLLRVAAGQFGRPAESMVWPLEFLQKFKSSDSLVVWHILGISSFLRLVYWSTLLFL
ncbi:unnamed protein product [Urochloa humidicola]